MEYPCTGRVLADGSFSPGGHLPFISEPKYIAIKTNHLRVNEWVIPFDHVTQTSLGNLKKTLADYSNNPESSFTREMMMAIIDRFQESLEAWSEAKKDTPEDNNSRL